MHTTFLHSLSKYVFAILYHFHQEVKSECNCLPKGLPSNHEAWIEVRRDKYAHVCKEYIGQNCSKKGEQNQNLTKDELKGLIRLKKRIKEGDVIVMCTDKSNKFTITDRETYKAMGAVQ